MAEHLASIFGTEKDRVNCPFYFKIGACRHGDRCSRLHTEPSIRPTLLLSNMYQRPDMIAPGVDAQGLPIHPLAESRSISRYLPIGDRADAFSVTVHLLDHVDEDFYEDLFEELNKYGEIESLNVCDNLADHMAGNVYVQFREEEQAEGPSEPEWKILCRQYEEDKCNRGGYCNFMHLKSISRELRRQLFGRYRRRHSRSRSRS
ncbi:hypothetical protein NL676_031180 [Syzygium grande]|nr:hypothetical protein NL676_031180 [Syzygium grande]